MMFFHNYTPLSFCGLTAEQHTIEIDREPDQRKFVLSASRSSAALSLFMLSSHRPFETELRGDCSVRVADLQCRRLARLDIILVDLRQQSGSRTEDAVPGPLRLAIQQDLRPNLEPRADDQQLPVSEQFGVGDYRIAGNHVEFGDEYILGAALCSLQRILHRKVGRISHSHYVGFAL